VIKLSVFGDHRPFSICQENQCAAIDVSGITLLYPLLFGAPPFTTRFGSTQKQSGGATGYPLGIMNRSLPAPTDHPGANSKSSVTIAAPLGNSENVALGWRVFKSSKSDRALGVGFGTD